MKAIMISIRPQWVAKILNGEKTIEVRKTMPKCDLPIDVYIYCTKDKKQGLYWVHKWVSIDQKNIIKSVRNGKVVAKFTLNKVDRYVNGCDTKKKAPDFNDFEKILNPSCLYTDELEEYVEDLSFYAWHISNLVIFDKPKELSEFGTLTNNCNGFMGGKKPLTKAPQSYMFIEIGE